MAPSEQITVQALQKLLGGAALAGQWILDPSRSTVSLKNKSMGGLATVKGVFRQITGKGTVSPAGEVSGAITIASASIDTKNSRRDTHLRSADFFDCVNYPDITFTAEGIRPAGQGVTVTGILRVRDRARPLTFEGTAAVPGDGEVWLEAQLHVNQADFGLTWNRMGMVSMNNILTIHAVFTRQ
jgi:polyisoprenoid-binding protein YceI